MILIPADGYNKFYINLDKFTCCMTGKLEFHMTDGPPIRLKEEQYKTICAQIFNIIKQTPLYMLRSFLFNLDNVSHFDLEDRKFYFPNGIYLEGTEQDILDFKTLLKHRLLPSRHPSFPTAKGTGSRIIIPGQN